ncbi:kelch-like protein 36 [Clytia hemisphaerica]
MGKAKRKLLPSKNSFEDVTPAKHSRTSSTDGDAMFKEQWQNSDAVLIVENQELHVHTSILSIASKYFEKMFNGNFKEAETRRVTLEEKSYDLVEHMLRLIYPVKCGLSPKSLLCNVCMFHAGTPSPGEGHYIMPTESNSIECQECGVKFIKRDHHEKLVMEHLQKLYQLSEEFFMDTITDKIIEEITRLSKNIQGISQAFFLLETAEVLELNTVKEACFGYLRKTLNSMSLLRRYSTGMNYSLNTRMRLKGMVLKNLVKMLKPQNNKENCAVEECLEIAGSLLNFDAAKEIDGTFLNTAFSSPT